MSVVSAATTGVAIDIRMTVTASKVAGANAFGVVLVRCEHRYWDDDPEPDVVETPIRENVFACSLPALFDAVDSWLREGHCLRALPHSWQVSACDGPGGCELLLVADALPISSSSGMPGVGAGGRLLNERIRWLDAPISVNSQAAWLSWVFNHWR